MRASEYIFRMFSSEIRASRSDITDLFDSAIADPFSIPILVCSSANFQSTAVSKSNKPSSESFSDIHAQQSTSKTIPTFLYHTIHFIINSIPSHFSKLPLQIQQVTPSLSFQSTTKQIAPPRDVTPELTRSPKKLFPQLRSLTQGNSQEEILGLRTLPMNWEYVFRPENPFPHLLQPSSNPLPTPEPPLSPWELARRQAPTQYYLDQRAMYLAEPGLDPARLDPKMENRDLPLKIFVLTVWAWLILCWMGVKKVWACVLAVLPIVAERVGKGVLMAWEVAKAVQWEMVIVAVLAGWVARWVPGIAGDIVEDAKGEGPLYVLMIPSGKSFGEFVLLFCFRKRLLIVDCRDWTSSTNLVRGSWERRQYARTNCKL
jgi:hypothetical protein